MSKYQICIKGLYRDFCDNVISNGPMCSLVLDLKGKHKHLYSTIEHFAIILPSWLRHILKHNKFPGFIESFQQSKVRRPKLIGACCDGRRVPAMPYSFLHVAALRNDVVKAQQLIDGEAKDDVHVWRNMPLEMRDKNFDPIFVDERDASGWTPLMIAATHGHMAMCKLLVEREADIHAKKNFKCSSLHLAARNGHKGIVAFLLKCNADVLVKILKSNSYSDFI